MSDNKQNGVKRKNSVAGNEAKKPKVEGKPYVKKPYLGKKPFVVQKNEKLPKDTAKTRRDRKTQRKMLKPGYELKQKCNKMHEKLRVQKHDEASKLKNHELVKDLLQTVDDNKTKLMDLVLAHDTARIIQTCLKQGTVEQRQRIFEELKDEALQLSKNKYANNILWKMVKYGTEEQRDYLMKQFKDNVYPLVRKSKLSAKVIEYAYNNYAKQAQRHMILREMCGKVYMINELSQTKTFGEVLATIEDEADKMSMMKSFHAAILPFVEKDAMKHTMIHKIFYEYFLHCYDATMRSEMIEAIRGSLVHIMHTHDGAHVTLRCFWYGTNKDRKAILKTMKEFLMRLVKEEFGHLPLLAAFDVIDDTVFLKKAILNPLMKDLEEVMSKNEEGGVYGRKVLAYLLSPRDSSHFLKEKCALLSTGDGNATSLKPQENRRKEIIAAVQQPIAKHFTERCEEMAFDRNLFLFIELALLKIDSKYTGEMRETLIDMAAKKFVAGEKKNKKFHIVEDSAGHLLLKKIIRGESAICAAAVKEGKEQPAATFSMELLERIGAEQMTSWSTCNRGAHVLLALVESENTLVKDLVTSGLKEQIDLIEENKGVSVTENLLSKLKN